MWLRHGISAEFKRDQFKRPCWLVVAKERSAESTYFIFVYLFQTIDRVSFYFSSWLAEGELLTLDLFKLTRRVSFLALYLTNSRSTHSIKATLLSFGATNSTL